MTPQQPKNSGKSPSIQFYWKDWLTERRLQGMRLQDHGMLIFLMARSMDMPTPGVFWTEESGPMTVAGIAKMGALLGTKSETFRTRLRKLIGVGLVKQMGEEDEYPGAYYIKRLYRDQRLMAIRREAGKRGGNPNLVKQNAKQTPTPSSSSSYKERKKKESVSGEEQKNRATAAEGTPAGSYVVPLRSPSSGLVYSDGDRKKNERFATAEMIAITGDPTPDWRGGINSSPNAGHAPGLPPGTPNPFMPERNNPHGRDNNTTGKP